MQEYLSIKPAFRVDHRETGLCFWTVKEQTVLRPPLLWALCECFGEGHLRQVRVTLPSWQVGLAAQRQGVPSYGPRALPASLRPHTHDALPPGEGSPRKG